MEITKTQLQEFAEVTSIIRNTQQQVFRLANTALIDLYWNLGAYLTSKIETAKWGDGVINQLADYIAQELPGLKGFSNKNLWRMKQFYVTYCNDEEKLSPLLRQISWSHNRTIMPDKAKQQSKMREIEMNMKELFG